MAPSRYRDLLDSSNSKGNPRIPDSIKTSLNNSSLSSEKVAEVPVVTEVDINNEVAEVVSIIITLITVAMNSHIITIEVAAIIKETLEMIAKEEVIRVKGNIIRGSINIITKG